ncbi:hypothetical protein H9I45_15040 [Polaribacter haliotis]|uniref:Uncharacterized protein n=1 Tax=Polaribacter haliotis TaxID=1888915 RepID=A0A7L8AFB5_9FLAO|nr:hypothetical protein [Polaribacter haliotis]QOD60634.1 hypothetical protein H9I45_15040 [Polaribacter haliotis]
MNAMYDREKDLHPADAYKLASRLMANDETVKNLIIYIVSTRTISKYWMYSALFGLGYILVDIIMYVC